MTDDKMTDPTPARSTADPLEALAEDLDALSNIQR